MVFIDNNNSICLIAKQNLFLMTTASYSIPTYQFYMTANLFKSMDLFRMEIPIKMNNLKQSVP